MAWKSAKVTEEVELPSGNMAVLQRPSVRSLFSLGENLPTPIKNMVADQLFGENKATSQENSERDIAGLLKTAEMYTRLAFLKPRIVDSDADGETTISIEDVSDEDMFFVMTWATSDMEANAQSAKNFHQEPSADVGSVAGE